MKSQHHLMASYCILKSGVRFFLAEPNLGVASGIHVAAVLLSDVLRLQIPPNGTVGGALNARATTPWCVSSASTNLDATNSGKAIYCLIKCVISVS